MKTREVVRLVLGHGDEVIAEKILDEYFRNVETRHIRLEMVQGTPGGLVEREKEFARG